MTLFDECKEALSADFNIVAPEGLMEVMDIFNKYPLHNGNILWSSVDFKDYDTADALLDEDILGTASAFVIADDASIPVFRTNFNLVLENIYDVMAICPKIFIFNDDVILHPLFPTDMIRLGVRVKSN
ncbi:hypothetical protein [[Enterobacter] lignolyticus]|uniref:Uncharacterized protein n=1 Tax=Enterobacter lignolyticus (strain SCF1) TaxID=701347 RepID=E3G4S1_ENTLS|nr:hypothetical protein [[Enterobacter] lignolyticus]ADO50539.1 hypothetical protein Entcl_4306 [[Enterobacter] lignolyticus SCF1]